MAASSIERDAIFNTQRYLRQLSFHNEEIGELPIDGIWGEATRQALMAFQRQQGIPATGTVDSITWERLKSEYDRSVAQNSPPAMLGLFPRQPQNFEIKIGDRGFLVGAVQYLLSELERLYYFPQLSSSGEYDAVTAATVADFQRRNSIPPTGTVGRETWDAMTVQHNLLMNYNE